MPPFYYGATYYIFDKGVTIFHPIPINFIVILGRRIYYLWMIWRSRPWKDKIENDRRDVYDRGYSRGYKEAMIHVDSRIELFYTMKRGEMRS